MSYFRISTVSADVTLADLGYVVSHPTTQYILSDQFSLEDLQNSADLTAAIQGGTLTAEVQLDGTWTAIASAAYNPDDIMGAFANLFEIINKVDNQKLVDGSEASGLHQHDGRYYTETELSSTAAGSSGAGLIGVDQTGLTNITGANLEAVLHSIDGALHGAVNLDTAYSNDTDGRMDVNGTGKDLDFRSNNVNDVAATRTNGTDVQDMVRADVSANEVVLGSAAVGGLGAVNTRVKKDLIIEGNLVYAGTIKDTTVDKLEVANADITMRSGATSIPEADASLLVERGTSGANADVRWNSSTGRWMAGVVGADKTIALLEANETVSGEWKFVGPGTTSPNMLLADKPAAPSANLGAAGELPIAVIQGMLCVYDKSNSRNKFLSVKRQYLQFTGRDSSQNSNEYARIGLFTSNQSSVRLLRNATLMGISAQTKTSASWSVKVRKNGVVTDLSSLVINAAVGGSDATLNVDFSANDVVEVFIEGTSIDRPVIVLEFADRF